MEKLIQSIDCFLDKLVRHHYLIKYRLRLTKQLRDWIRKLYYLYEIASGKSRNWVYNVKQ